MTPPANFSAQAWATAMLRASSAYTEATYALANAWRNGVRHAVESAAVRRESVGDDTADDPISQGVRAWQTAQRHAETVFVQSADTAAHGAVALADTIARMTRQNVQAALVSTDRAQEPLARALLATHSALQLAGAQLLARHAEATLHAARRLEAGVTHDARVVDIFEQPAR